ncbi:hypothetical protein MLD38_010663 [Melastoma candidum]|uniref:Uncharacterized protein n=1 Tax=Melastoma candidum TaxID=119954 RepID=A0ACB9R2D4_9MYRT|nr:hypothetical protein MLD38_010663 [Melastoma candidum]
MKELDAGSSMPAGSGKKSASLADPLESLRKCDFFDKDWVRDDSYPLYKPDLPRLSGSKMLELLRGKRLAFVGDSLNRNMWESLACIFKGAAKDQSKVYEANDGMIFRGEASYFFIFKFENGMPTTKTDPPRRLYGRI